MNERHTFTVNGISRRRMLKAAAAATAFGAFSLTPFKRVNAQSRVRQGLALCIGLNLVDPKAYRGWNGALSGCVPDSQVMEGIAQKQGFYDVVRLNNEKATIDNVRRYIAWAANDLRPGDIFMISCSSHGAYRTDTSQPPDEVDGRDETWCLWDGQWTDDDRYAMWKRFARGVRVLVVGDMCHSGTTARALQALQGVEQREAIQNERAILEERSRSVPRSRDVPAPTSAVLAPRDINQDFDGSLSDRLKKYAKKLVEVTQAPAPRGIEDDQYGANFNLDGNEPSPIRSMPDPLADYLSNVQQDKAPAEGEPRSGDTMRASGLLLAACQDSQTALDGTRNGVFTNALNMAWKNGAFQGTYETFYQTLQQLLRDYPTHQPNRDIFGASDAQFNNEAPFLVK